MLVFGLREADDLASAHILHLTAADPRWSPRLGYSVISPQPRGPDTILSFLNLLDPGPESLSVMFPPNLDAVNPGS